MSISCKKTGADPTLYLTRSNTTQLNLTGDGYISGDLSVAGDITAGGDLTVTGTISGSTIEMPNFRFYRAGTWTCTTSASVNANSSAVTSPYSWDHNPTDNYGVDTTEGRYYFPIAGVYRVTFNVRAANDAEIPALQVVIMDATDDSERDVIEDTDNLYIVPSHTTPGSVVQCFGCYTTLVYADVGDSIWAYSYQDTTSWRYAEMSGHLVSAKAQDW